MKQIKTMNQGWKLLSIIPLVGLLMAGMGLTGIAHAGPIIIKPALQTQPMRHIAPQGRPDLQVRVWVDTQSVHQNANHSYNFTIRGQLKNVGSVNYVSRNNQQVLFLHEVGKSHHITDWHFSRLNRGQVMNVHVPVRNQPGGEFVPAYELALSFAPDIYTDRNSANDDRNRRNNQAIVSSRTISAAFARASGGVRSVRPVGVRPGTVRPNVRPSRLPLRGKKPDLIAVVVNANQGAIQVKNIGSAASGPSHLFLLCSRIHSHFRGRACVNPSLHLPNFITRGNGFSLNVPALRSGASYRINLWGPGAMPASDKVPDTYAIGLTVDWDKQVSESNEQNNLTRLDTTIRPKLGFKRK